MSDEELRAACKNCRLKGYGNASRDTLQRMLIEWRPLDPDQRLAASDYSMSILRLIGPVAFGEDWQTPMARELGITPRHLRFVLAGTRTLSPVLSQRVEKVAQCRLAELEGQVAQIRQLIGCRNATAEK